MCRRIARSPPPPESRSDAATRFLLLRRDASPGRCKSGSHAQQTASDRPGREPSENRDQIRWQEVGLNVAMQGYLDEHQSSRQHGDQSPQSQSRHAGGCNTPGSGRSGRDAPCGGRNPQGGGESGPQEKRPCGLPRFTGQPDEASQSNACDPRAPDPFRSGFVASSPSGGCRGCQPLCAHRPAAGRCERPAISALGRIGPARDLDFDASAVRLA